MAYIFLFSVLESSVFFSTDLAKDISHLIKYYFTLNRMVLIKKQTVKVASIGQDVEKPQLLCFAGLALNWYSCCGK